MLFERDERIQMAIKICEELNDLGCIVLGEMSAHFNCTPTYLGVHWGNILLWDSEGIYLEDKDFIDEQLEDMCELSMETCMTILNIEVVRLNEAFGCIDKMKEKLAETSE